MLCSAYIRNILCSAYIRNIFFLLNATPNMLKVFWYIFIKTSVTFKRFSFQTVKNIFGYEWEFSHQLESLQILYERLVWKGIIRGRASLLTT